MSSLLPVLGKQGCPELLPAPCPEEELWEGAKSILLSQRPTGETKVTGLKESRLDCQ